MDPRDGATLGITASRQEASDHAGASSDDRARSLARFGSGVPVSQLAGIYGPACDASDPAEWAGEPHGDY